MPIYRLVILDGKPCDLKRLPGLCKVLPPAFDLIGILLTLIEFGLPASSIFAGECSGWFSASLLALKTW